MLASVEGSVARLTQICERAFSKRQTYKDQLRDSEAAFSCGRWPLPLHCYNRSSKKWLWKCHKVSGAASAINLSLAVSYVSNSPISSVIPGLRQNSSCHGHTSKPIRALDGREEPRSGVSWVGRWSSGDVEFTVRSSREWHGRGDGRGGNMQFVLVLLLQTTGYRTGDRVKKND